MPRLSMASASRPPALQPYPLPETACNSESKSESDLKLVSEERCHTGVFKSGSESPKAQRHACPRCGREFMSNGHLKRHAITHSGQKNHPCPFPGCVIKCSRHDNLQQHYRTHFPSDTPSRSRSNPKSRKNKLAKTLMNPRGRTPPLPSINSPPPLEEAYSRRPSEYSSYPRLWSPPLPSINSPPPLEEAYSRRPFKYPSPPLPSINPPPPLEESYLYHSSASSLAEGGPSPQSTNSPPPMEGSYSSQSSEYSSSYSTVSSPPHTPPELALASPPMLILPRIAPVARHLESPLRPQRLHIPPFPVDLAKPTTEDAMFIHHSPSEYTVPATGRPLWTCVPLVHPIPRSASQPRSPLLDYPSAHGEDAENVNEPYEIEPPSCPPIMPMPMPMPIEPAPVLELDMLQQHQQEYFYTSAGEYSSTGMYTTASPVSPQQQQQLLSPLELPVYMPHAFAQHAPYRVVSHYPHSQYYSESDVSPEGYAYHAQTHSY